MLVAHVQARNRAVEYWRFCLILLSVLGIVKIVSEPLIEISTGELLTNHRIKKVVRRRVRPGQCGSGCAAGSILQRSTVTLTPEECIDF